MMTWSAWPDDQRAATEVPRNSGHPPRPTPDGGCRRWLPGPTTAPTSGPLQVPSLCANTPSSGDGPRPPPRDLCAVRTRFATARVSRPRPPRAGLGSAQRCQGVRHWTLHITRPKHGTSGSRHHPDDLQVDGARSADRRDSVCRHQAASHQMDASQRTDGRTGSGAGGASHPPAPSPHRHGGRNRAAIRSGPAFSPPPRISTPRYSSTAVSPSRWCKTGLAMLRRKRHCAPTLT